MIAIDDILRARDAIADDAIRTPLVKLQMPEAPGDIYLKLETLQPIGSFKIRGAANAIRQAPAGQVAGGVVTASAGNMAQGVAWVARSMGAPCTVVAPDSAPRTKLDAIERLGARTITVPFDEWWRTLERGSFPGAVGLFVHPVRSDAVMAGNGTIGLEIVDDLPDPDVVLTPWGGGGLSCGVGTAIRALAPRATIYGVEPETAAPLNAAFAAGEPRPIEYRPSFVDGAGGKALFPAMWEIGRAVLDGARAASLDEIAGAIRLLAERTRIIAEGAGALPVAVALSGRAGSGTIVCVVSGGNIDSSKLSTILEGRTP